MVTGSRTPEQRNGVFAVFNPNRLYRADELGEIAPESTLAKWRHRGTGPAYLKMEGHRIRYEGSALNAYLASKRVRPTDEPPTDEPRATPT